MSARNRDTGAGTAGGDGSSPQNADQLTKHGDEAVPAPFSNASPALND